MFKEIMRLAASLLIAAIHVYQKTLGPLLGNRCRFYPSCSHYMADAIHAFGPLRGIWMGAGRLLRCQPFSEGGYDPLPSRR